MNQNEKKAFFGGLLVGALVGAIVSGISALLMAPYSGEATRQLLKAKGSTLKTDTERRLLDAVRDVEDSLERASEAVSHWADRGNKSIKTMRKPSAIAGRVVEKVLE
jgi:gas vesicle protein